ncbi:TonB-dependent receptor [Luteimonas sp. MC1825]|uniref:TonB-dependent receptor n=1 Tax=Luteimonas sp. MC1825 TaxID=2761107 RepID=UPI001614C92A|nr:TonB-dependent receptor [Luteimonas sp. MC1825]MBB6599449.1 TonB-dependent receptor [Luteimonas sp. MC1825]QOC89534.1 TonB-dependent receptor [Luteimonas sp. MC1825]
MKPAHIRCTTLSLAIVMALAAPALQAQDAPADEAPAARTAATQLDAITVTARRRTESIMDVPVAVSAFGEEQLKDLQATDISGLQGAVPNLNIVQGRGSSNTVNVFIRGIGQPDSLQTFDPGVGMYVDDVYYSRINGALFSLFDVQQVEVLRGPQGTLYGKNSTGGAIKVATKNPFDDQGGAVEVGVGSFGRTDFRAYLGEQLSERAAFSIAGAYLQNDGYVDDPVTGEDYNGEDTLAFRGKLALRPSDTFSATLSADYTRQDNALTLGQPTAPLFQTRLQSGPGIAPGINFLHLPDPSDYDFKSRTSFGPNQGQEMTHKGFSANLQWDLSEQWTAKSISAWRKLDTSSFIDIDASEWELGDVLVEVDQEQMSQELQLQFDNGSNVQAIFGAYYMNETLPSYQEAYADDLFVNGSAPVGFLRTIADDLETTSVAAFAHINWEFAPTWTLAAGLRYSRDEKDYDRTTSTFWTSNSLFYLAAFNLYVPFQALNETVAFSGKQSWDAWTPSLSLQKAFSDNVMGYVSANRGFKSGGFNGRANTALETTSAMFDPEFVWTYEAGVKMRSSDGRFTANVAAFHSSYEDFQARVSEVLNPNSPTPTFSFPVLNAAEMEINGFEFEGVARLGDATLLSGQVGWMDASYKSFADLRTTDPSNPAYNPTLHEHVPFSPDWTARVALQHTFQLGGSGALTVGGDVAYRGDTWLSVDNRPGLMQEGYTTAGLFTAWDSPQYAWQIRAGVRNATDELYKTEGQEFSSVANIQTAYYAPPRNWYLSVRRNFSF